MAVYRVVKRARTVQRECPRCHNGVEMMLVRDRGLLVPLFTSIRLLSPFSLKCPICIHSEPLTNQQAYSLMDA
jgi:hypothetical protein